MGEKKVVGFEIQICIKHQDLFLCQNLILAKKFGSTEGANHSGCTFCKAKCNIIAEAFGGYGTIRKDGGEVLCFHFVNVTTMAGGLGSPGGGVAHSAKYFVSLCGNKVLGFES